MSIFWQFVYSTFVIPLMWGFFQAAGLLNEKVRRGIRGRADLFEQLASGEKSFRPGKRVWIHSASLGEFEQGKAIIAGLRKDFPDLNIVVTFFSPSGYENSRKYALADLVAYIPFDSRRAAARFLDTVQPDLAVFVRYDIWPNHLWELHRRGIPTLLVNATMSRLTLRRLPLVRSFHRSLYNTLRDILTVSSGDAEVFRLLSPGTPAITPVGDTRFDQVTARSIEARQRAVLPDAVLRGRKVLVAGSCWNEDNLLLLPVFRRLLEDMPEALLVHVPHEPTPHHLSELSGALLGKVPFARLSAIDAYAGEPVIIVDSVGKLLPLYSSAHVAFIGGGFGHGVHNVLEAAVFGVPVVFGPRHYNSQEPLQLIDYGGGFVAEDEETMERIIRNLLEDDGSRRTAGERAAAFVVKNTGTTERVIAHLRAHILNGRQERQEATP
jgi:3-deoxy-D-manno-octulosonic-acid transferase